MDCYGFVEMSPLLTGTEQPLNAALGVVSITERKARKPIIVHILKILGDEYGSAMPCIASSQFKYAVVTARHASWPFSGPWIWFRCFEASHNM